MRDDLPPCALRVRDDEPARRQRMALAPPRCRLLQTVLHPEPRGRAGVGALPRVMHAVHPVDVRPRAVASVDHDPGVRNARGDGARDGKPTALERTLAQEERAQRTRHQVHRHA